MLTQFILTHVFSPFVSYSFLCERDYLNGFVIQGNKQGGADNFFQYVNDEKLGRCNRSTKLPEMTFYLTEITSRSNP